MDSRSKWDQRYANAGVKAPTPPLFLERYWQRLQPGRVLDLAAGDGAVSLFLAARGFESCAVDISSIGLARLQQFMNAQGLEVETQVVDLESEQQLNLSTLGQFDSIVISRYKPQPFLWPVLLPLLNPGGTLLLTTFNYQHHQRSGFSKRFCITPCEYLRLSSDLELTLYSNDLDGAGMDGYIFRKI